MRNFTLLLLALLLSTFVSAQSNTGFWESIDENQIQLSTESQTGTLPQKYHTFQLDLDQMRDQLYQAPAKGKKNSKKAVAIDLPLATGQMMTFLIEEKSLMMPKLQAKYHYIRSYVGVAKDNPAYTIIVNLNTLGFSARIRTPQGLMHIAPYATKQDKYYTSFFRKDYVVDGYSSKKCGVKGGGTIDPENPINAAEIAPYLEHTEPYLQAKVNGSVTHRTYRLAIAAPAQHTNEVGGLANVMSRIAEAVNILNEVYQRELAVSFVLIEDNDKLIQTDVSSQPYQNVDISSDMLGENQAALEAIIGLDAFDIGHVFTVECSDGNLGVAAFQSLCNDGNKGRGVTCNYNDNLALMVEETMLHEVGHQFGASHTWDFCNEVNNDNREPLTAYEPMSGTTIMSYAGVCGFNVQPRNDTYFHTGTIIQVNTFLDGAGGSCAGTGSVDNNFPTVSIPYTSGFTIPINTPFELTAEGSDPDGDDVLYCWDQFNKNNESTPLGQQMAMSPSFRSWPPTENPTRTFPAKLDIILNNTFNQVDEVLPDYTRNLKFRCSVRDVVPEASGAVWSKELSFEATSTAGPFVVNSPNSSSDSWEVGTQVEVTWDVANTDVAPVNCEIVDIYLSTDGGFNFTHPLAVGVPNTGSRMVVVPNSVTNNARVKVKAGDNIFFDMSNANFKIEEATTPGFIFDAGPYFQRTCLPENVVIDMYTESLLGYDSLLTFTLDGLPMGAVATFTPNPARPSEDVSLVIDMSTFSNSGTAALTITATGDNLPPATRDANIEYIANDFSALSTTKPAQNAIGVAEVPEFTWTDVPTADTYMIEIATSPEFGSTIVESKEGLTVTNYTPTNILQKSTVYYWRITPVNICGMGTATSIAVFQTATLNCSTTKSGTLDITIPAQSNQSISSTINLGSGGSIIDINIPRVQLSYSPMNAIKIELESPSNKKVVLAEKNCGGAASINFGFDQDSPNSIASGCPSGGGVVKPIGDLSTLYGDNAAGDWILTVSTVNSGFGTGNFTQWDLEICSNSSVSGPTLINNNALPVLTDDSQWISNGFLRTTDPDQNSLELIYTIVEEPVFGHLEHRDGSLIRVGSKFAQADLDNNRIKYIHDGVMTSTDGFYFVVEDGDGGFIGKTLFSIEIGDNNAPLSTETPLDLQWGLFPNPAQDIVNLTLEQPADEELFIKVFNVQGKMMEQEKMSKGQQQIRLSADQWPIGMYFIEIGNGATISTQKVIIQR